MSGRPENDRVVSEPKSFDDFDLSLGDIMRGERATMGKSLLDVQRELKIKATYIAAIENTDPAAFDTPGFIAGYVRSYARYLGLDPEWAFKTFCDEGDFSVAHGMSDDASVRRSSQPISDGQLFAPKSRKSKQPAKAGATKKPAHLRDPFTEPSVSYLPKGEAAFSGIEPRAIGSIAVLLLLLGGIGYGGWSVLQEVQKVRLTPVDQTPEVLAELDPLVAATLPSEDEASPDGPALAAPSDRFDRLYRPEALDLPVLIARDGPISAIDPDTIGALAPQPGRDERFIAAREPRPDNLPFAVPGTVADAPEVTRLDTDTLLPSVQVVEASSPNVSIFAVRPSWVRVQAVDGTIVFEKILDAGEAFEVPLTEEAPQLRAGNAGSLYFEVRGQTYGPAGDGPAVIKGVALDAESLVGAYPVADVDSDADLKKLVAVAEAQASQ